uniref:CSON011620 protein n=1 Tax=Culicoides sonorensis TaxID=179676 RepID=A0A336N4A6_CULSO
MILVLLNRFPMHLQATTSIQQDLRHQIQEYIANDALIHCKSRTSNANSSHASSKQQKDKSAIDHSSTVDCTLSLESTGQECLDNMCQRIGIQQPEFFGLKYLFKGSFSAHIHDGCQFIECPFGLCKWKSSRQQLGCEFSQFKCFPR